MDISQSILSDIIVFQKFARHLAKEKRRETWDEICDRNMQMHLRKFPELKTELKKIYTKHVKTKNVLPSMRSMQFGGTPIELSNNRLFNCAYLAINHPAAFWETMFLLLGGSGVGFSVQQHHIKQLGVVKGTSDKTRRFLVGDSIEGWSDAVKVLVRAHYEGKPEPLFDFRDVRKKGARLITSGGKAPGPEPLRICLEYLRSILISAKGRELTSVECHDMMCHIADAVLSGGIRRAALISLFSIDDLDMLSAKTGDWFVRDPQRGRSNNSVVLVRKEVTEEQFKHIWNLVEMSGCGEPGFQWTNNKDLGCNPCGEISLKDMQFCNLTEVNVSNVIDQEDLNDRVRSASIIGTIQATYTDFHYLRPEWKENTEADALLGIGLTGIASGIVLTLDLDEAAQVAKDVNKEWAARLGINPAARVTTVKPSGDASGVIGCSSGVHSWHDEYFIRSVRVGKSESLYPYMVANLPTLVEDCKFKPHLEAVMMFPQKAPEGAILRSESALHLLKRVKKLNREWVENGYRYGDNHHNVSCTISIKPFEWERVGNWMWENRHHYTGISVLPYDAGTYVQAPFATCTKEVYDEMMSHLHAIDLRDVKEVDDNTNLSDQVACAGNACEINLGAA